MSSISAAHPQVRGTGLGDEVMALNSEASAATLPSAQKATSHLRSGAPVIAGGFRWVSMLNESMMWVVGTWELGVTVVCVAERI